MNAIRYSKRQAQKAAAIKRLEYWREKGKENRAKVNFNKWDAIKHLEYWREKGKENRAKVNFNKWDAMSKDEWGRTYERARRMQTRRLMFIILDNEGRIKPEFRHSPYSAVLLTRVDRMTETELEETGLRVLQAETADELVKR